MKAKSESRLTAMLVADVITRAIELFPNEQDLAERNSFIQEVTSGYAVLVIDMTNSGNG